MKCFMKLRIIFWGFGLVIFSLSSFARASQLTNQKINWTNNALHSRQFPNSTYNVLIFQDNKPWNSVRNEELLGENYISYDMLASSKMGNVDLNKYDKVIFSSHQSDNFYSRIHDNIDWFETWVKTGGILEMHLAGVLDGGLDGLPMPGGLIVTLHDYDEMVIENSEHPILNTPHAIEETNLNEWHNSAHGYFSAYPQNTDIIVRVKKNSQPACVEIKMEQGTILGTTQAVEWDWSNRDYHENIIVYFPEKTTWPALQIEQSHISASLVANQFASQSFEIVNSGEGVLDFSLSEESVDLSFNKNYEPVSKIDALGDVLLRLPFPNDVLLINGLAWGDDALWAADLPGNMIYKIDGTSGDVLTLFPAPGWGRASDLAHNGSSLFSYDFGTRQIYRLNLQNGAVLDSFPDPLGMNEGFACDGQNLWRGSDSLLVKFSPNGQVLATLPGPGVYCDGLAFGCGTLWYSTDDGLILQIEPTGGLVLNSFVLPAGIGNNGLAYDGQNLRAVDNILKEILTIETECLGDCPWLSLNPMVGSVPPFSSRTIAVDFITNQLEAGNYACNIHLNSNDPQNPHLLIPVELVVEEYGPCEPPCIKVSDISGVLGDESILEISIEDNQTAIESFGFRLLLPYDKLEFVSLEKGELIDHFAFFEATTDSGGNLVIGGFDMNPVPANSFGILAKVKLRVLDCNENESTLIKINELKDDLQGINICPGIFNCEIQCLLGDVNMDHALTPADANCAMSAYLNDGSFAASLCQNECAPASSDAQCDGQITPADARKIFIAYLENKQPPLECDNSVLSISGAANDSLLLKIAEVTGSAGNDVRIAVTVENGAGLTAWGFKMRYSSEDLEFIGIERGELLQNWQEVAAFENTNGTVTIGGYHPEPMTATDGEFLSLVFKIRTNFIGKSEIQLTHLVDDVHEAATQSGSVSILDVTKIEPENESIPKDYYLSQNFPNPFNQHTSINFELPYPENIELLIFNSLGQKTKTLISAVHPAGRFRVVWDGTNEQGREVVSGIYWCTLRAGEFWIQRKIVFLK